MRLHVLLLWAILSWIDSRAGLQLSPFLTSHAARALRKHFLHLFPVINLPSADAIVAILAYFGRSLEDTGSIAAFQAVDKVAGVALPTEDREELALALLERLDDERIAVVHHLPELFGSRYQDIRMHSRQAQLSHALQAVHKWFRSVFDNEHIQVAFGISLATSDRPEEDYALLLIGLLGPEGQRRGLFR